MRTRFALGLGANRSRPGRALVEALDRLEAAGVALLAVSPVIDTAPLGPGLRRYANAAALVETDLSPPALLVLAKSIERAMRRRRGRRWGDRTIDIDLLLWSGGAWRARDLSIPHPGMTERDFVLRPLAAIAPRWRIAGPLTVARARARLTAARPLHRGSRSGPSL